MKKRKRRTHRKVAGFLFNVGAETLETYLSGISLVDVCIHPCCSKTECSKYEITFPVEKSIGTGVFPYLIVTPEADETEIIVSFGTEDTNSNLKRHQHYEMYRSLPARSVEDTKLLGITFLDYALQKYQQRYPVGSVAVKTPVGSFWSEYIRRINK